MIVKQLVMEVARNDVQPYYADSGNLMLKLPNNSRRVLMKHGRVDPTELGFFFFATHGKRPPRGYGGRP